MDKEMNKKEIAKKVIELCNKYKTLIENLSTSQFQNLRYLGKRTQIIDEIKIYLEYQATRMQLKAEEKEKKELKSELKKFLGEINEIINNFKENPEDLKYFIGNLVRYATSIIKSKEG
jgi:hypothetical protein